MFRVGALVIIFLFGTQIYSVEGRIVEVRKNRRVLVIEHEEIPGYMPPMIMPFSVWDTSMATALKEGDAIWFRLAASGDSARITTIQAIPDSAVVRNSAVKRRSIPFATDNRAER